MMDQRPICEHPRLAHEGLAVTKTPSPWACAAPRRAHLAPLPPQRPLRPRPRPRDLCTDAMARLLEIAPQVSAAVIRQRLQEQGCAGGITIVRDYCRRARRDHTAAARQTLRIRPGRAMPDRLGPFRRPGFWRPPAYLLFGRDCLS